MAAQLQIGSDVFGPNLFPSSKSGPNLFLGGSKSATSVGPLVTDGGYSPHLFPHGGSSLNINLAADLGLTSSLASDPAATSSPEVNPAATLSLVADPTPTSSLATRTAVAATLGLGRQQWWIGLGRAVDGLSGLVDGLFHFFIFLNYLPRRSNKRLC